MARLTKAQRKKEIKTWRALYEGTCTKCSGSIEPGVLVTRSPETGAVIHYHCHPDWFPAPLKVPLKEQRAKQN
jgi:hypothetical protein